MPAHNKGFPWMSYYGHYNFFESAMQSHSQVSSVKKMPNGVYEIKLSDGRVLSVFICECYAFGLAEYYESVQKLGSLNAVIINSNWCGYSMEAKLYCRGNKVGLFDIAGFMAALNKKNYWEYLTESETEYLAKNGH